MFTNPAYPQAPVQADPYSPTYTVKTGESWTSISSAHRPAGTSKDLYAKYIRLLNGGKLTNGRTINL